jgi:cell filamentation protein
MPYDSDNDPYLDSKFGVLKNRLGIVDPNKLEEAEAIITTPAIALLKEEPILGDFDLKHLQAIHKQLFSPLYTWAGELRRVVLTKGSTQFANPDFIEQAAKELFHNLQSENLLLDLDDDTYLKHFAHYYSEVNILHPFREGNGRTQRAFFSLLADQSQKEVAWDRMNPEENLEASIAAYNGDESKLINMLRALIEKK